MYAVGTPNPGGSGSIAAGFFTDGVYGVGTSVRPTTAWSIAGAFEHLWTPSLKTSIYGSYIDVSHSAAATTLMCAHQPGRFLAGCSTANCNMDWQRLDDRLAHRMGARQGLHRRRRRDLRQHSAASRRNVAANTVIARDCQRRASLPARTSPATKACCPARSACSATSCPDRVSVTL